MAAILLSFREGLEAALIVGIVLSYLTKAGEAHRARAMWTGVFIAGVVSVVLAALLFVMGAELEGTAEALFEGVTMLLAAIVLTWMIFWMQSRSGEMRDRLKEDVQSAVTRESGWGLFWLAFVAVVREGVELALFLTAAVFASSAIETVAGAIIGLTGAVLAGWLIFAGTRRLDLQRFFAVSGLLLLLFAAGLVGRGFAELHEAGLLPSLVEEVWNTRHIVDEHSTLGSLLKTLLRYSDSPSLLQVAAYAGYAAIVLVALTMRRHLAAVAHRMAKLFS